jgi:hypothetical protein
MKSATMQGVREGPRMFRYIDHRINALRQIQSDLGSLGVHLGFWATDIDSAIRELEQGVDYRRRLYAESQARPRDHSRARG